MHQEAGMRKPLIIYHYGRGCMHAGNSKGFRKPRNIKKTHFLRTYAEAEEFRAQRSNYSIVQGVRHVKHKRDAYYVIIQCGGLGTYGKVHPYSKVIIVKAP